MANHIMLDLENLDFTHTSVILTFGAVKFDPFAWDEDPHDPIYFKLDIDSQIAMGRTISDSTLEWWQKQPAEIFEEAMSDDGRIPLDDFLKELNRYRVGASKIWAQGPLFDIDILENLYKMRGTPVPWMYYDIRDSRTVFDMGDDSAKTTNKVAHNALADAFAQACAVRDIYRQLRVQPK